MTTGKCANSGEWQRHPMCLRGFTSQLFQSFLLFSLCILIFNKTLSFFYLTVLLQYGELYMPGAMSLFKWYGNTRVGIVFEKVKFQKPRQT